MVFAQSHVIAINISIKINIDIMLNKQSVYMK